jgi:hypothetical protein
MDRTIVHFEIPANNPEKLSAFYKDLFGWKFEKTQMKNPATGESSDYWMIETRDGTAGNMEKAMSTAGVNGGMMKKMMSTQQVTNYVSVESVDDFSKKAETLGAKVIIPKTPIPQMGAFAVMLDPDGNPFGLFESSE